MKKNKINVGEVLKQKPTIIIIFFFFVIANVFTTYAQDIKWLRVSDLQTFVNEVGAEYEGEIPNGNTNYFSWPSGYGIEQNTLRMRGLWIGCKNFNDPVEGKVKSVKVIGSGPRDAADRINQIFEDEFKMVGKFPHPTVIVDNQDASIISTYDLIDSTDENMSADRTILVKFHTSIGITVTKKVSVFANSEHGNYYINDYTFTNTGIYNEAGNVSQQTLQDLWFYFIYRYAFAGVSYGDYVATASWGAFSSTWGASTLNHTFGSNPNDARFTDPNSPTYQMRGFYSYYGPSPEAPRPTYDEDWGCPNLSEGGLLSSAKFAGCVTLHADKSPIDKSDDIAQPKTTWFIGSDINILSANVSQYDEIFMSDRYTAMTEGHPPMPHDEVVGNDYAINYSDPRRQTGGGTSQGQGYGPYTLAPGESIRIVFTEGVDGISWEKGREVGNNWLQWKNNIGSPTLTLPNGSTTTNFNQYKKDWVFTGVDSILQTYRNAINNFDSDYSIPQPPPPPENFTVTSGGDRIFLEWASNAASAPHFGGYEIYRSVGTVMNYKTQYQKIFECEASNVVHNFDDVTAVRGFDYYYYIVSKDDGTQNQVQSGVPLRSSKFWTMTSVPATLQRPAVLSTLDSVRVVPNPYDIRARMLQFGDQSQLDRIAFYGLPPICKLKIFTERGDLIWEKEHTRGTGDELWDSTTSYGQIVASGIYILYVEAPDGRKVIRKFVIIR